MIPSTWTALADHGTAAAYTARGSVGCLGQPLSRGSSAQLTHAPCLPHFHGLRAGAGTVTRLTTDLATRIEGVVAQPIEETRPLPPQTPAAFKGHLSQSVPRNPQGLAFLEAVAVSASAPKPP